MAFIDEAGAFHVGPRSAGSEPGPACYGRGGVEPTVTDAQIVLGRLDPGMALGGDLKLDASLSFKAIEDKIARPLGLSVTDAALGIIRIINNNMALAIRSNSVARGIDPRAFSIMPFGGAGPLHGAALADAMACKYQGQGFELRAAMPEGAVTAENRHLIADSFHDQHHQDYGFSYRKAEVELITLRAIGTASVPRIESPTVAKTDGSSIDRALMFVRPTTFDDGRRLETPRYDRTKLMAGEVVPGPALLHQHDATTLIPPDYLAETLDYGNTHPPGWRVRRP